MFKRSVVPASGKPDCVPITKKSRLMLLVEIITVRCDDHTKHRGARLDVIASLNRAMHNILAEFKFTY
jgi:hypothetical protein